jgi:HSP20 family protein
MRVGPDGKPRIEEFGNAPEAPGQEGAREPLTDIIEENERIRVIVELPGVEKEDIQLHVEDHLLDISVDREDRKFSKTLELPARWTRFPRRRIQERCDGVFLTKFSPKKRGRR